MWNSVGIAITIFMVLAVGVVVWAYLAGERRAGMRSQLGRLSGRERIRCHICRHVYEAVPTDGLSQCPFCDSFNQSGPEPSPARGGKPQAEADQESRDSEKSA